jgi:hypothetical protein
VVLALVGAVVAASLVPVEARLRVRWGAAFEGEAELSWGPGVFGYRVGRGHGEVLLGLWSLRVVPAGRRARRERRGERQRSRRPARWLNADAAKVVWGMVDRAWRSMRWEAQGRLRVGFEDPAVTGWLFAVAGGLELERRLPQVRMEPDFLAAGVRGWLWGRVRARPATLVAAVVSVALSPAGRRLWRYRRGKE